VHRVDELRASQGRREIWISAVGVKTEFQGRLAGLSPSEISPCREAEEQLSKSEADLQWSLTASLMA